MRDGHTRQIEGAEAPVDDFEAFQRRWQASIVLVSGDDSGAEFELERTATTLGRGESAHLRFADAAMSSEHAALEFQGAGFRIRDLASMNGTLLNGSEVKVSDLKNGDQIRIGALVFQFVLVEREKRPRTYQIPVS